MVLETHVPGLLSILQFPNIGRNIICMSFSWFRLVNTILKWCLIWSVSVIISDPQFKDGTMPDLQRHPWALYFFIHLEDNVAFLTRNGLFLIIFLIVSYQQEMYRQITYTEKQQVKINSLNKHNLNNYIIPLTPQKVEL